MRWNNTKTLLLILSVFIILAVALGYIISFGKQEERYLDGDEIIARIGEQNLNYREFKGYAKVGGVKEINNSSIDKVLNDIVAVKVLSNYAKNIGITVGAKEILNAQNENIFNTGKLENKRLANKIVKDLLMVQKLKEKLAFNIDISSCDVEEFYNKFRANYVRGPYYKIRKITLNLTGKDGQKLSESEIEKVKDKAGKIKLKLDKGEKFETLQKIYSNSYDNEEYLAKNEIGREIYLEISNLRDGEISNWIETTDKLLIVKLISKKNEELIGLEEAEEDIKRLLVEKKKYDKYQGLVKSLTSRVEVKKNDKNIEKIRISDLEDPDS